MNAHICSFQACPDVTLNTSYEEFKRGVLAVGRFSSAEATVSSRARDMYTRLWRDPDIVTDNSGGYPWTAVRLKTPVEESE